MTAEIILYADCQLLVDKNYSVDDINDYLSTLTASSAITINYFKHDLETSIKLQLGQEYLDIEAQNWNYCKITNGNETSMYYFITDKQWRSKEVLNLNLYLDTISSLGWLSMTDKTLIHRAHLDRWKWEGLSTTAYPIINKNSEGINPLLLKSDEMIISEDSEANFNFSLRNRKWYIGYFNNDAISPTDYNQVNPVKMLIFPEGKSWDVLTTDEGSHSMTDGENIVFSPLVLANGSGNQLNNFTIKLDSSHIIDLYVKKCDFYNGLEVKSVRLQRSGSTIGYSIIFSYYDSTMRLFDSSVSSTVWLNITSYIIEKAPAVVYSYKLSSASRDIYLNASIKDTFMGSDSSGVYGVEKLDRTDSRIIKVIELPYCPLTYEGTDMGGSMYFVENIEVTSVLGNTFVGVALRQGGSFLNRLEAHYDLDIQPFPFSSLQLSSISTLTKKNKKYETKLYHSDFYNFKIVYDSFSALIKFENIDFGQLTNFSTFIFDFVPSMNMQSSFIIDYSKTFKESGEIDYPGFLYVSRNNEIPIYTSQYVNYLRTGYNYDVKAKNFNEIMTATSNFFPFASGALNTAMAFEGGNTQQALSGLSQVTSSITSSLNATFNAELSLERKQAELQAQASSIRSADDISLLNYYTKVNKPKFVYYEPSSRMINNLFNLFYYTGYAVESMGIIQSFMVSRARFNYIQAEIDLSVEENSNVLRNIPKKFIDDYKARFNIGLTRFHKLDGVYDFEQKYENWETWLLNYISHSEV